MKPAHARPDTRAPCVLACSVHCVPARSSTPARPLRLPRMIDVRAARADPDTWRAALARKGAAEIFDEFLQADEAWRAANTRVDELRAARKPAGKGKPSPEEIERLNALKEELKAAEAALEKEAMKRDQLLTRIPILPTRQRQTASRMRTPSRCAARATRRSSASSARDHLELGAIDMERGAKVSGSPLRLPSSATWRLPSSALLPASPSTGWRRTGFTPVLPPVLVRRDGHVRHRVPRRTDEVNIYRLERRRPLPRSGTSEVALAALPHGRGARRVLACPTATPGTRRASAGRRARPARTRAGMFRVHQFDKVEMFVVLPARGVGATSTSGCWPCEEELVKELEAAVPGRRTSPPATSARRRDQEVRLRGVAADPGALPGDHLDVQLHRVPGAAARASATARRAGSSPCTR